MNVDSAACWRTLSNQGTTGNGIDTCLNLVIVREAIQSRFRRIGLLTSRVSAKHTRRVSVKVWVVGLCSSEVCVGRIQRSQQR